MLLFALGSLIFHSMQRGLNREKYSYGGRMKEYQARTKQRQDAFQGQEKSENAEGVYKASGN
jgi:hypothetical protein